MLQLCANLAFYIFHAKSSYVLPRIKLYIQKFASLLSYMNLNLVWLLIYPLREMLETVVLATLSIQQQKL